ncbi:hypothetical protein GGTG_05195 [Gaeumannomyces tritici R3-111a-1]|uniref:Uncharacterized protein n=1 Tax=Gaeumannomyces tritici (strain R3-111a-1) TaxID=644352 RepID=J3NV82_GAET3|nr:hypothetical protein GGTG_05195 [Gaeumannomyces tritici R3-111a-1]EJT75258.1 hypothetical protein GGTG_05195 [Gaeumannomyces tritici R3-111a-1]
MRICWAEKGGRPNDGRESGDLTKEAAPDFLHLFSLPFCFQQPALSTLTAQIYLIFERCRFTHSFVNSLPTYSSHQPSTLPTLTQPHYLFLTSSHLGPVLPSAPAAASTSPTTSNHLTYSTTTTTLFHPPPTTHHLHHHLDLRPPRLSRPLVPKPGEGRRGLLDRHDIYPNSCHRGVTDSMASTMTMSSTSISFSRQPDAVADKVLRRAELGKMARRLQNSLALAKFKTTHGLEELTLDSLEPRFEEERRRRRMLAEGDMLSDSSSSSASDLPYYPTSSSANNRALTSSPLKAAGPIFFSDAIGPSSGGGSTGYHRKRTYMATFDGGSQQPPHYATLSSPSKRFRSSPTPRRARARALNPAAAAVAAVGGGGNLDLGGGYGGGSAWRNHNQLAQSSPIKPRRQQHFTTSTGPDVSLFKGSHRISEALVVSSPPPVNYAANLSDDDDDLLPVHSFALQHGDPDAFSDHSGAAATAAAMRSSPPQTPPMRNRSLARNRCGRNHKGDGDDDGAQHGGAGNNGKTGEDAADLLLYLAASPSPATRSATRRAANSFSAAAAARMDPPSTPPPRTAGGGGGGGGGMALPSSMMTTPGGGNPFPATPSFQTFDFADFVNITPSPAPVQRGFKTPVVLGAGAGTGTGRTPISETRRRLTFDDFP